ncbi:MAG: hypothetical protein EPO68_05710 [Planctomycetota bacterium]|nr:MAG: hypothetical protein EPO68_05710 [Planctomycetota bacterium]
MNQPYQPQPFRRDVEVESALPAPRMPRSLRALLQALRTPCAWLPFALVPLVLALGPALAWTRWFQRTTEHRATDARLLPALDETFRFDHRASLGELAASTGAGGAWLALVALLAGCACAGGALALLVEPRGPRALARSAAGAASTWFCFVRVALLEIALLALAGWLLYGMPWRVLVLEILCGLPNGDPQEFASEASAVHIGWLADGLSAACFAAATLWAVHVRTRVVLGDSRSVLVTGARAAGFLLRHPLRAVLPALAIGIAQIIAVFALGAFANARNHHFALDGAGMQIAVLAACTLLALAIGAIARVAQYALAVELVRELVPMLASPRTPPAGVGAPGGPQYPIDGDEFGVSV